MFLKLLSSQLILQHKMPVSFIFVIKLPNALLSQENISSTFLQKEKSVIILPKSCQVYEGTVILMLDLYWKEFG